MHAFEYILLMLGGVLLSILVGNRFRRVSIPLIQIVIGVALTILPISFEASLDPELFLVLFIAPLLFEDAKKADKPALWRLRRPILLLALGLVIATTLIVGFAINWFTPSIPLAIAFALAAALAPTDAVAVSSLSQTTTISSEQGLLLKGESLLNDASSIVSFQFAIAAALTGAFSVFDASTTFLIMFFGGLALGVALMLLRTVFVGLLRVAGIDSINFHVLFEVVTPLLVFLIAEHFNVSGIIAVVAAGITYSFSPRMNTPNNARHNIVSTSVWSVISFTLNGLVFLMLGTQLPYIAQRVWVNSAADHNWLIQFIVLILVAILLLRFIWVLIMHRNVNLRIGDVEMAIDENAPSIVEDLFDEDERGNLVEGFGRMDAEEREFTVERLKASERKEREQEELERKAGRKAAIRAETAAAHADPHYWKLHLHDALLLSLTGVKGAITLAVVLTIPLMMSDGAPFPERDLLLFLASGVILLSLLAANILVPLIAPKKAEPIQPQSEINAILDIYRSVIHRLIDQMDPREKVATDDVIRHYYDRIRTLKHENEVENQTEAMVRAQIVEWEREHTNELIDEGRVSPLTGLVYLDQLSRVLARTRHHNTVTWEFKGIIDQFRHRWGESRRIREKVQEAQQQVAQVKKTFGESAGHSRKVAGFELRELQLDNFRYVINKLEEYAQQPGAPKRVVEMIAAEFERRAARFENLSGFAARTAHRANHQQSLRIEAKALDYEREAINEAQERELITRETAKQLRDNIALMELDIEEQLE